MRKLTLAAMLLASTSAAHATLVQPINSEPYGVFADGYNQVSVNGENVLSGVYTVLVDGVVTNAVCDDIAHYLNLAATYTPGPLAWASPTQLVQYTALLFGAPTATADQSTAKQDAAWKIEYGNAITIVASSAIEAITAQDILFASNGTWTVPSDMAVVGLYQTGNQGLAYLDALPVPVPEAGCLLMFLGAAGITMRLARRQTARA